MVGPLAITIYLFTYLPGARVFLFWDWDWHFSARTHTARNVCFVYAFALQIPNYECLRMKWKRKKPLWMYGKRILTHSLHSPCIYSYIRMTTQLHKVWLWRVHAYIHCTTYMYVRMYTYPSVCLSHSFFHVFGIPYT